MTTALVTGASSGIGAVFAERLAAQGHDLVLIARSQDQLQAIADSLQQQYGIQAMVIAQDLTATNAGATIFSKLEQADIPVDILVNNAGFGAYGEFAEDDLDTHLKMIQLNVMALVELAHRCLPGMKARRSGSILNISSTAAFQPIPYLAVYSATKAFVLSLSEALWYECKPYNIKVIGVCPGPTDTEFFKTANFPESVKESANQGYETPQTVVEEALKALNQGDSHVVTGGMRNQFLVNVGRFLPRETLTNAVGQMFKAD